MELVMRIGRALMMGLAWAAVWVPVGAVLGALNAGELEPEHIGGPLYAGVLCGAVFSAVAGLASRRRRLADMPFGRAAAWASLGALVVAAMPFALGGNFKGEWTWLVAAISSLVLMSAVSGVVSVWVARSAKSVETGSTPART